MTMTEIRRRIIRLRRQQREILAQDDQIDGEIHMLISEAACQQRRTYAQTTMGRARLEINQFTPSEVKRGILKARKITGMTG